MDWPRLRNTLASFTLFLGLSAKSNKVPIYDLKLHPDSYWKPAHSFFFLEQIYIVLSERLASEPVQNASECQNSAYCKFSEFPFFTYI